MTNIINEYNNSKYGILYIKIINKAKSQNRVKLRKNNPNFVYYEIHHILPKSIYLEYSSLKENPWNAVLLTAREHFICHLLLTKHYKKTNNKPFYIKMSKAFMILSNTGKYNSHSFSSTKLNLSCSDETKQKIGIANKKSYSFSQKRLDRTIEYMSNRTITDEFRDKMSKISSGSNHNLAKTIHILDENLNIMYICNGDFKKVCEDNNLPFSSLRKSYQNNGLTIFNSKRGINTAKTKFDGRFINWSAIVVG